MSNQRIYINGNSAADGKLSDAYRTPEWIFDWLDDEYGFTCDAAASDENHLCDHYYTLERSALDADWSESGGHVFCNPPFSSGMKEKFLEKAYREMAENGVSSVFVIPADPSNKCWLDNIFGKATRITIINGRVKFLHPETGEETSAGIGTAIIEFQYGEDPVSTMDFVVRDEIKRRFSR